MPDNSSGLVVLNIYIPAFTRGVTALDLLPLKSTLEDLLVPFPGDSFILAGDFNNDRFEADTSTSAIMK
jgi:hypothetical protein